MVSRQQLAVSRRPLRVSRQELRVSPRLAGRARLAPRIWHEGAPWYHTIEVGQEPRADRPTEDSAGTRHPPASANAGGWKSRARVGLPQDCAGAIFHTAMRSGKVHGMIAKGCMCCGKVVRGHNGGCAGRNMRADGSNCRVAKRKYPARPRPSVVTVEASAAVDGAINAMALTKGANTGAYAGASFRTGAQRTAGLATAHDGRCAG